jgi:hypothetical protein
MIVSISQFRNKTLSFRNWVLPITVTHITFPALGYYAFWGLHTLWPTAGPIFGLVGFVLIGLFIYESFCELVDIPPLFGISEWFSELMGIEPESSRLIMVILAVSWDGLWCGPALASQAIHWSATAVMWSFLIAGTTVFVLVQLAMLGARWLRRVRFSDQHVLAKFTSSAKWLELSVIGGFGVLSLWRGFTSDANLYLSIMIAGLVMAVLFIRYDIFILMHEYDEAAEALLQEKEVS